MTLIGKILVFVILVMSIIFMTFTILVYSTHRNWRELAEGLNTKLKNAEQLIQEKQTERDQLENRLAHERASRAEAIAFRCQVLKHHRIRWSSVARLPRFDF